VKIEGQSRIMFSNQEIIFNGNLKALKGANFRLKVS